MKVFFVLRNAILIIIYLIKKYFLDNYFPYIRKNYFYMEKQKRGPKGPRLKKGERRVNLSLTCQNRHKKELTKIIKKQIADYERSKDSGSNN